MKDSTNQEKTLGRVIVNNPIANGQGPTNLTQINHKINTKEIS